MKTTFGLLLVIPTLSWGGMGNTGVQNSLDTTILNDAAAQAAGVAMRVAVCSEQSTVSSNCHLLTRRGGEAVR
jgi:hypothetical protein